MVDSDESLEKAEVEEKIEDSFATELRIFTTQLRSINVAFPLISRALSLTARRRYERMTDFLNDHAIRDSDSEGRITYDIPSQLFSRFSKIERDFSTAHASRGVVSRSLIVSLVTEFDSFFASILRLVLSLKPEVLNASDRKLTFAELMKFSSLNDAQEHMLEHELSAVLFRKRKDQFLYVKERIGCDLQKFMPDWQGLVEITERRNVFVHHNGRASANYLENCSKEHVNIDAKLGEELKVTRKYFDTSYQLILQTGFMIALVLWKKFIPTDNIPRAVNALAYDLIVDEEYQAAQSLIRFVLESKIFESIDSRSELTLLINLAQTHKWLGEAGEMAKLLNKKDWSIFGGLFQLSERVLMDDFANASVILTTVANNGDLSDGDLQEWPIFKEFRKSNEFQMAFEALYPDAKKPVMIEPKNKSEIELGPDNEQQ